MGGILAGRVKIVEEGVVLGSTVDKRVVLIGWGGEGVQAPTPLELMLLALGSCTAIDVYSLLSERGATVRSLEVLLEAERAESPPKRLTKVRLTYVVEASGAGRKEVEEAIKFSMEKYCSVGATIKEGGVDFETQLKFKKTA